MSQKVSIRLPDRVVNSICKKFQECFLPDDKLWIFGSRVDINKKGGDIDLYIETNIGDYGTAVDRKITFSSQLKKEIGDQKIDVIFRLVSSGDSLPIHDEAKTKGVQLV